MLQIRLFGKPQVICDGTDITPELGNKGCALLCILFLRGGDYYAREKLAAYLWPDSAVSAAKYNLRYTLWKIKKSTDTGEGGRSLIKLDREYCCIDRAYDYICDLQTIDEIDPETRSADELKRACDAFGGELLEGYYFNHCEDLNELILSQRIYYEKRKNRLLMKAAELYEQRDMLPEAVGILERVMEYEPYNEQLALRLMTLYERGGDRSRAIRFFNEFRNRLASNLEIYPGSAITQKYAELKAAPAAPEPAPAADSVPGLHVQTYCLRAVPCFWMADTVGKLLDAIGYDVPSGDRTLLRVLGAIQPAAAACVGGTGGSGPGVYPVAHRSGGAAAAGGAHPPRRGDGRRQPRCAGVSAGGAPCRADAADRGRLHSGRYAQRKMTAESAGYLPERRAHPNFKARKRVAECLFLANIFGGYDG